MYNIIWIIISYNGNINYYFVNSMYSFHIEYISFYTTLIKRYSRLYYVFLFVSIYLSLIDAKTN